MSHPPATDTLPATPGSRPPPPRIPHVLRHIGQGWVIAPLLLLTLWAVVVLQPTARDAPGVHWPSAQLLTLQPGNGDATPLTRPQEVSLPDSWQPRGLASTGVGRYALTLVLPPDAAQDARHQPWALRIDRLSPAHQVSLNGQLLHSSLPRPGWLAIPGPHLLDVPGALLHGGRNELIVETHCAGQCGLTPPVLARKADLQAGFALYKLLTRDLLVILNIVCITFSVFVVMLWWLRRQEAAAGLFGLLIVVAALRNCRYFYAGDLNLSANLDSWLYFTAHVVTACVQCWFIKALARQPWPLLDRLLWGVLLGFPSLALLAMPWDPGLGQVRNVLQGALILLMLPSFFLLVSSRKALSRSALLGLGMGWLGIFVASVHDFSVGRMVGTVTFSYWLPWAIPLALPSFSVMVVERIVSAFNEIEQVNQRLETKVAERTQELAAANAAKSHFLAAASHDLRQPVAAIGLITDLLHSRLSDPALRSLTDRLTRAVNSMESLLKGLLDLSRLDSGTVEVQRRRVHLQPLLEAVTNHEMESARHKGLRLRIRPTRAVVWTDPVLLEQMLRNLVGNAIRHTAQGGVLVGVRRQGAQWVLQVWDQGPGIGPADQQRIFEAFVQLANPARDRSLGLGLGLAIVRRASTLLSHPVQLRSVVGRGSVFGVAMPAAVMASSAPAKAAPPGPHTALPCLAARKVLVIEDDRGLRDTLVALLHSWGVAQVQAGDGLSWVRALPQQDWDLVLSDHRLADGTGREVVRHLRAHQARLAAVILTGDTSPEQLAELAHSGLPVLHKPFRADTLRAVIDEALASAAP